MKTVIVNQLNTLPCFTKNALRGMTNESDNTLNTSIKRMFANNQLIKLKNGVYLTSYYFNKNGHLPEYREFLANTLCQPSYLSLKYILAKHDVLTEGFRPLTSVTLKTTRSFENKLGSFLYQKISPHLFTGYQVKHFGNNTYLVASKSKALFDYLYLSINQLNNPSFIKEQRLRLDIFTKSDWREFKKYLNLTNNHQNKVIKYQLRSYAPNL